MKMSILLRLNKTDIKHSFIDYFAWIPFLRFRYLQHITEVICRNPELVLFFDMYSLLDQNGIKSNKTTDDSESDAMETQQKCTVGIQTDTHPIPYAKDKNYTWNSWDKLREAIKLANLQKSHTKSTQTACQSTFGTQTIR